MPWTLRVLVNASNKHANLVVDFEIGYHAEFLDCSKRGRVLHDSAIQRSWFVVDDYNREPFSQPYFAHSQRTVCLPPDRMQLPHSSCRSMNPRTHCLLVLNASFPFDNSKRRQNRCNATLILGFLKDRVAFRNVLCTRLPFTPAHDDPALRVLHHVGSPLLKHAC